MRISCTKCGVIYGHHEGHDCSAKSWGGGEAPTETKVRRIVEKSEKKKKAIKAALKEYDKAGTSIHLRIPDDLLERLDKARGGMTRPGWIRSLLEEHLPE